MQDFVNSLKDYMIFMPNQIADGSSFSNGAYCIRKFIRISYQMTSSI